MFYTYAHYTPQGRLFYIGKGQGGRAHSFYQRGSYWQNIVNKYGKPTVQILADWTTEKEAFDHERLLIACFKDMNMQLCNRTDGGEGFSGFKRTTPVWNKGIPLTEECKQKLSAAMKGRSSWNKGKKHTSEHVTKVGLSKVGNLNCLRYKIIGVNKTTGQKVEFIGAKAVNNAGFKHTAVYLCINGKRKSHGGFTWYKEAI